MKPSTRLSPIRLALAWGAAVTPLAQAGGIQLYESGTPDVGLASAGYAARAQDASTVFRNPAGTSLLDGSQFQGGLQVLYGRVEFSADDATSPGLGDNNGGVAVGALPAGSLFFTQCLSERFAVGLGAFSYFGLAEEYDDTWHGAIGTQFRASEPWRLSAGFAYDTSAVSDEHRTLSLPMGEAYRFGLGAEWQVSQADSLGAAAELPWGGDMPVTQESAYRGRVSGSFEDSWFASFTVHRGWQF